MIHGVNNIPNNNYMVFRDIEDKNECFIGTKNVYNSNVEQFKSSTSAAVRAYGLNIVQKNKVIPQMPLRSLISLLETRGKIVGKDFNIDTINSQGIISVSVLNKLGKEEMVVFYDMKDTNTWSHCDMYEYGSDLLYKRISYDKNNKISEISKKYNNKDFFIGNLALNKIKYGITPNDLVKELKKRNIDCNIEYSDQNKNPKQAIITILDKDKNITDNYIFNYGHNDFDEGYNFILKNEYNNSGQKCRSLWFDKDSVTDTKYNL